METTGPFQLYGEAHLITEEPAGVSCEVTSIWTECFYVAKHMLSKEFFLASHTVQDSTLTKDYNKIQYIIHIVEKFNEVCGYC